MFGRDIFSWEVWMISQTNISKRLNVPTEEDVACDWDRLAEEDIVKSILAADSSISRSEAKALVKQWFVSSPVTSALKSASDEGIVLDLTRTGDAPKWADDDAFLAWAKEASGSLASNLKVCAAFKQVGNHGNHVVEQCRIGYCSVDRENNL
jgi:hypothetical protein